MGIPAGMSSVHWARLARKSCARTNQGPSSSERTAFISRLKQEDRNGTWHATLLGDSRKKDRHSVCADGSVSRAWRRELQKRRPACANRGMGAGYENSGGDNTLAYGVH